MAFLAALALVGCAAQNTEREIVQAQETIAANPDAWDAWYTLGSAYLTRREFAQAVHAFQEMNKVCARLMDGTATQKDEVQPCKFSSAMGMGLALYEYDQDEAALPQFNEALQLLGEDRAGWVHRYGAGKFEKDLRVVRGMRFLALRRFAHAKEDFDQALRLQPDDQQARALRGWALYWMGAFAQAKADFDAVSRTASPTMRIGWPVGMPLRASSLLGQAYAYLGLGDTATAVTLLREAQARTGQDLNRFLMLVYVAAGDEAAASAVRGGAGWIGVRITTLPEAAAASGTGAPSGGAGMLIDQVATGGPSAQAGLLPGDRLRAVEGQVVATNQEAVTSITALVPGHSATLTIEREGQERQVTVVPGSFFEQVRRDPDQFFVPIVGKASRPAPPPNAGPR